MFRLPQLRSLRLTVPGSLALLLTAPVPVPAAMEANLSVINRLVLPNQGNTWQHDASSSPGLLHLWDDYPDAYVYRVDQTGNVNAGKGAYRHSSLFTLTFTGTQYGRTFTLRGKLGRTRYRPNGYTGNYWPQFYANNGCQTVMPNLNQVWKGGHTFGFDPLNLEMDQDCVGQTPFFVWDRIGQVGPEGEPPERHVYLDLGTLLQSEAWRQLPVDRYQASTNLALEGWRATDTGYRFFDLPITVTIRKQAYFSGLQIPNTQVRFQVSYLHDKVYGSANTPLLLQGAFDPTFGRVKFSVRSTHNFQLQKQNSANSGSGQTTAGIAYQVELRDPSQRRYPLNEGMTAKAAITLENLNSVQQIPLELRFNFEQARNALTSGSYTDQLTLIAEVPFV